MTAADIGKIGHDSHQRLQGRFIVDIRHVLTPPARRTRATRVLASRRVGQRRTLI
jgi:hypothetical protein